MCYYIMEIINDLMEYGFIDSRVYKCLKYKEWRMCEVIDGDVLKFEVIDDLFVDVWSIIENEWCSIVKVYVKMVNVEIEWKIGILRFSGLWFLVGMGVWWILLCKGSVC